MEIFELYQTLVMLSEVSRYLWLILAGWVAGSILTGGITQTQAVWRRMRYWSIALFVRSMLYVDAACRHRLT